MDNFTPEDLLLYLYKEASTEQTATIEQALSKDWPLREKLEVLKDSMRRLEKTSVSPRVESVLKVLNYARQNAEAIEQ